MIRVLVSACLLGEKVRYHGGDVRLRDSTLAAWVDEGRVVAFCPEVAGGLPVPRPPAEIQGDGGLAVLDRQARVTSVSGEDVTGEFVAGALRAVDLAQDQGVGLAVLVDGSPSCGTLEIHDGSFSGRRRRGQGVTTAALERSDIRVFSEAQMEEAAAWLAELEESTSL